MANTNPSATEVRNALRDYKVDFQTIGNWDTVGNAWNATGGGLYGCIMHHTGANISGYSGAPALTWMRTAYNKPACNILVGRGKGDTYLLSSLAVYHSGLGGPWPAIGINSAGYGAEARTFGVEIEGSTAYGNVSESRPYFTEYQEENAAKIAAALWDLCGWPDDGSRIVTHGDWTDSGKYLKHSSYGPYRGRKGDTRRTTHSGQFWRKKAEKYRSGHTESTSPDPKEGKNSSSDDNDNVVNFARTIPKNAVAVSTVAGTPQNARFALMNLSNESIYISEGDTDVLTGSGEGLLWLKARTIVEGEPFEVSQNIDDKSSSGELIIESTWVQNENIANAALSLISSSFKTRYKSIEVEIFGNPLIQLGDLVKFTYDIGQVVPDQDEYYYVSKVIHTVEQGGMSTTVTLNPVTKSFEMV